MIGVLTRSELLGEGAWDAMSDMTRVAIVGCALSLASCAGGHRYGVAQPFGKEAYAQLLAEVGSSGPNLKRSLPELKYAANGGFEGLPLAVTVVTKSDLRDADGQSYRVLVLHRPSMSYPGSDLALAYLKTQEEKIVDWVARWSYNRHGILKTKFLDVNDDGLKELCFVRGGRIRRHEQLLAAYLVDGARFEAVIPDDTISFNVGFKDTTSDGFVISPQLKGDYHFQQDKLMEIPVLITNTSSTPKNLRRGSLEILSTGDFLSMGFGGMYMPELIEEAVLQPGESVETTVTIQISSDARKRTIG
ncbi:MAG: hypothetical protein ACYTKD_25350, partial [Planctomycetota bacterium]